MLALLAVVEWFLIKLGSVNYLHNIYVSVMQTLLFALESEPATCWMLLYFANSSGCNDKI